MRTRRLALVGPPAVLAAALALVTGWPDPRGALGLLTGNTVTSESEVAFLALLCWVVVAGLLVAGLAGAARDRPRSTAGVRRWRPLALLVAGVALLGIGFARHHAAYQVCCSTVDTAQQVQSRVP